MPDTSTTIPNIPWDDLLRFSARIQAAEAAKQQVIADFLQLLAQQTPSVDVALAEAGVPATTNATPQAQSPAQQAPAEVTTANQQQVPKKLLRALVTLIADLVNDFETPAP